MLDAPLSPCRWSKAELPSDAGIDSKVRFLSQPDSYPEPTSRVEVIETHYSWVFLTDRHAYKLKKPVQGVGFDFRSVAARRRNALAELRLNRRLARDVYLDVVPLTLEAHRRLAIGGCGAPVDWLVKMVRLRANRMLDQRLAGRTLSRSDIEPVARHLAAFFATAPRAQIRAPQLSRQIKGEIAATRKAFAVAAEPRLSTTLKPVARRLEAFRVCRAALLQRRVRDRRLVDGHGDLRPEHVYINGMPRIIDCLEFRADLRRLDPVGEIAYLALECRRLGGPAIERPLLRRYRERTGDRPPEALVRFYAALNAIVRARIAVQHLNEPRTRSRAEWLDRAACYLAIAAREMRFLRR